MAVDISLVSDDWEELVSAGVECRKDQDVPRWSLGDLGLKVERKYKEGGMKKYAHEIGSPLSTLYEYTAVSNFYTSAEVREMFPVLSWSHYKTAARLGDFESAMDMLKFANDEDLSVDALAELVDEMLHDPDDEDTEPKPKKLFDLAVIFRGQDELMLHFEADQLEVNLTRGRRYILKVFAKMVPEHEIEDEAVGDAQTQ